MKKNGFALAETLIVSIVVAGILIYLFIHFATVKRNYSVSLKYNRVNNLYALEDVIEYIRSLDDNTINTYIVNTVSDNDYLYVLKDEDEYVDNASSEHSFLLAKGKELLEVIGINDLIITDNNYQEMDKKDFKSGMVKFMKRIKSNSDKQFRIWAYFNDDTYASLPFDINESCED